MPSASLLWALARIIRIRLIDQRLNAITQCDLIIVGAGIHGAALAREAASRGWTVILLEQYAESALGTSSKSSKLIHGGLRYLESFEFSLVRECLVEQRILLRTAPHLVKANQFFIPITQSMKRPPWVIQAGLWLYYLLGGKKPSRRTSALLAQDGLNIEKVSDVLVYHDAQTDDKKLTEANLASARAMGADIRFNSTPTRIEVTNEGVTVFTAQGDPIHAKALANLSGPWLNDVLALVRPPQAPAHIDLIKGSHIVLPEPPQHGCYYLEAEDGRVVFVMPWRGKRLVGTTEVHCDNNTRQVEATEAEIEYLLATHNRFFSQAFSRKDVIDAWAGLRVLPKAEGNAFKRPREAIFMENDAKAPRLLSLVGGKLTSHRATAVEICKRFGAVMPPVTFIADTTQQALPATD